MPRSETQTWNGSSPFVNFPLNIRLHFGHVPCRLIPFDGQPASVVSMMKSTNFSDLLWNIADEIDTQYKQEELLSSVQFVDDIQSIYDFGMNHHVMFTCFGNLSGLI